MRAVRDLVSRLAQTELTLLVTGETGTGKGLVAQDAHRMSARSDGPFCVLNCAEARARPEILEQASGGTLFLDEVGELSAAAQAALLGVLDADVRVIAATHRDLEVLAQRGDFRRDLLHRLCIATIAVPPLRERRDEIAPLSRLFLTELARAPALHALALSRLEEYDWPGNVRELRNVIARAAAISSGGHIAASDVFLPSPRQGVAR